MHRGQKKTEQDYQQPYILQPLLLSIAFATYRTIRCFDPVPSHGIHHLNKFN